MSYREVVIVNQDITIDILVEGNLARRVTTGFFPSQLHEILLNNPIVVNCTQDFYFPEINDKWDGVNIINENIDSPMKKIIRKNTLLNTNKESIFSYVINGVVVYVQKLPNVTETEMMIAILSSNPQFIPSTI